jgi:prohibitin 2
MSPRGIANLIGIGLLVFVLAMLSSSATYMIEPGYRGVQVTLGKISPVFKPEGFGFKLPLISHVYPVIIRQSTHIVAEECFSSDLQQVKIEVRVLQRIPEASVVKLFQSYEGDPFTSLVEPRVSEAIKEVAAQHNAEMIVKKREEIKTSALELARKKLGPILLIEDIVFQNITLTHELETAIEAKMVQEQEVAKAKFTQLKVQTEADTAVIKAKGEAESIEIRGKALRENPSLIKLQIVEKWDGNSPLVVGSGGGGGLLMSLDTKDRTIKPAQQP